LFEHAINRSNKNHGNKIFDKRRYDMINIKCKKCGWELPFSAKVDKDSVCNRGQENILCPKCGEMLVRKGGKINRWY